MTKRHDRVSDHVAEQLIELRLQAGDGDDGVLDDHTARPGGLAFEGLALIDDLTAADALTCHHGALALCDGLVVHLPGADISERTLSDRHHVGVRVGRRGPPHGDVEVAMPNHVALHHVGDGGHHQVDGLLGQFG